MLNAKQEKAIALMLEGKLNQKQIAAAVKVSENTMIAWKRKPEFITEYNKLLKESLTASASKAVSALTKLLESKNEFIKLSAAKDILDRAGLKSALVIESNNSNTNMNENVNIDLSHLSVEELKELLGDES